MITKRTPEEAAAYLQGYRAGVETTVTRMVAGMSPSEIYDLLESTLEIATSTLEIATGKAAQEE